MIREQRQDVPAGTSRCSWKGTSITASNTFWIKAFDLDVDVASLSGIPLLTSRRRQRHYGMWQSLEHDA
jgi:hypothetical protein